MTDDIKPIRLRTMHTDHSQRGKLYKAIRKKLSITQCDMARLIGLSRDAITHREYTKRVYTLDEMVKLQEISGLSWDDFGRLMKELS